MKSPTRELKKWGEGDKPESTWDSRELTLASKDSSLLKPEAKSSSNFLNCTSSVSGVVEE